MDSQNWVIWEMSVNNLFYNIVKFGVRKLVQNSELRAKTVSFVKDQVVPQAKTGCAVLLEDISAVEVAVLIEMILDRGMDGGKLLKGLSAPSVS